MFPLAQSGLSFLIYLIVGIFWLVGNLMQQKQAKQKAEEIKRRRQEREEEERRTGKKAEPAKQNTIESELEAFLGRLGGEEPAPPPPRKTVTYRPVQTEDIQFDGPAPAFTPPPPPARKAVPPPRAAKDSTIGELNMEASFKQISEMKEVKELISGDLNQLLEQEALTSVRSMMVDLSSSTISVPTIPMPSIRTVHTKTNHLNLQKKKTFKKALVASFILETPKALQANPHRESA